jgi:CRISPR/Cas system-associated exonuclease Cas4 (RecB family)
LKVNPKNKNGLTGKSGIVLGALLFTYDPTKYLSMLSINHRIALINFFELCDKNQYKSYGEQIIKTHNDIIAAFKNKFEIDIDTRALSCFIYSNLDDYYHWKSNSVRKEYAVDEVISEENENEEVDLSVVDNNGFVLEKHLEDFLVANWENTELGKFYDLIEENGDIISQQYPTNIIGNIDLLVKEKETGNYVVIELKKGQTSDKTIGQLTRYMGWVKENKSGGKRVKGIIIAGGEDERLKYAINMVPDAEVFLYKINFILKKPE